jgi:hypothetical protein
VFRVTRILFAWQDGRVDEATVGVPLERTVRRMHPNAPLPRWDADPVESAKLRVRLFQLDYYDIAARHGLGAAAFPIYVEITDGPQRTWWPQIALVRSAQE